MGVNAVLVVGGGIAGIQASLDLAERGVQVYLLEKEASIGGRMVLLDKTFPTMDCSVCILAPKMIEAGRHPNITLLTYSELESLEGEEGNFTARVRVKPRGVDPEKCIGCGQCSKVCPSRAPDQFNEYMAERTAIYRPFPQAVPNAFVIDYDACIGCRSCERTCPVGAVDVGDEGRRLELGVGAVVVATGLEVFDPAPLKELGFGRFKNVITAFQFERMLSATGCTLGEVVRPSDGFHPRSVAFVQCVGSRSLREGHPYCSSVCCMYATKEAILAREHLGDAEVTVYYTDIRAFGKDFWEFVGRAQEEYGVRYVRGRPSEVREDPETGNLWFWVEDTLTGELSYREVEMMVLSTALEPSGSNSELAQLLGVELDDNGFFKHPAGLLDPCATTRPGVYTCGYAAGPKDIPDSVAQAAAAACRAAYSLSGGGAR